jgi:two-component system, OmpR family, alkaline phosphatase synthesis response regulator PhoP
MTRQLIKALVVDDDESILILLRRVLTDAGYNVMTAANGQEAIDIASGEDFDVALLDISMPGMSGIEVLHWLSENRPAVCPVMITAVIDVQTAVGAMKTGAYDYITKPFLPDEVLEKVRRCISRKKHDLEEHKRIAELENKVVEQTAQLQQQFTELVETLAREHSLLYKLAESRPGGIKAILARLEPELREPLSSVEEFREALLRILRRQA